MIDKIKKDIKHLQRVADAIGKRDYSEAYKHCRLQADIYYKPVDVISKQLSHNVTYDAENGTNYAEQYALHLICDAERVLTHRLNQRRR